MSNSELLPKAGFVCSTDNDRLFIDNIRRQAFVLAFTGSRAHNLWFLPSLPQIKPVSRTCLLLDMFLPRRVQQVSESGAIFAIVKRFLFKDSVSRCWHPAGREVWF